MIVINIYIKWSCITPVSYTHLDVYKRQIIGIPPSSNNPCIVPSSPFLPCNIGKAASICIFITSPFLKTTIPVSYTHLDVYKRQQEHKSFFLKQRVYPRPLYPVSYTHLDVYKRQSLFNYNIPLLISTVKTRVLILINIFRYFVLLYLIYRYYVTINQTYLL